MSVLPPCVCGDLEQEHYPYGTTCHGEYLDTLGAHYCRCTDYTADETGAITIP